MDTARIAARLEPFLQSALLPAQLEQISTYIDLLLRWNARINLTAVRSEEEIVPRHFGESLFLARHLFPSHPERSTPFAEREAAAESKACPELAEGDPCPSTAHSVLSTDHCPLTAAPCTLLDIGSGAGFPALPLKIWAPRIHLTLVESNHKKAAFLREVTRVLTLINVNVITERAEALAADPAFPRSQVVTLRAVESFQSILPQAAALLAPHATLALLIGASQVPALATLPNLSWNAPLPIPQSNSRVLSIGALQ
jgi:16S rRNA (guanine527-N7)-methyltransferase